MAPRVNDDGSVFVHHADKGFAGFEGRNASARDLDPLAGLGMQTLFGRALFRLKTAETCKGNGIARFQRLRDGFDKCFRYAAAIGFGNICLIRNDLDNVALIHTNFLTSVK